LNLKETLIEFVNEIFKNFGIEPILGTTLLFFLIVLPTAKKIKVWDTLSRGEKQFIIIGWVGLLISIYFLITHFLLKK
jgi:hypothetical protein